MKLLVLTTEPITAAQLREALSVETDPGETEVMVVAPALAESPVRFWFSDADDAIGRAEAVRAQSLEQLSQDGVSAVGETGESDPMQAIQDALQTFPADRIVLFAHREGGEQRYREDVDEADIRQRFGLPIDRALLP